MFTGIVEEIGTVSAVDAVEGGIRLSIDCSFATELKIDESVSVSGACQTVVATTPDSFSVVAIEETLRKTTMGGLEAGSLVNLERAMLPTSRLDGHIVQGHVDATGSIRAVQSDASDWLVTIQFPIEHSGYLIPVGSITVDGISLTVARLGVDDFTVAIIPHTLEKTTASDWEEGKPVNLEFDLIGKYVVRHLQAREATPPASNITEDLLRNTGFID